MHYSGVVFLEHQIDYRKDRDLLESKLTQDSYENEDSECLILQW